MYSAIKVKGKEAYKRVRKGEKVNPYNTFTINVSVFALRNLSPKRRTNIISTTTRVRVSTSENAIYVL